MWSWINSDSSNKSNNHLDACETVLESLKRIYKQRLLPLEDAYHFHDFHSPRLDDPDFTTKPMIMLVGQYSTGKTTFIRYLLERDFPGIRIGPEPTTDGFIAVMYGENDGVIPGNALVVDPKRPFRPLSKFGNAFLNRLQCSLCDSPVLRNLSIIDTPGILAGEKQRVDRGYEFTGVLEWFAERVDRIILLFDAHKLDISDEFRRSIQVLRNHDDKIRIVLNKADMMDHQQLMHVYGALMWSLGKVLATPEVSRVYIGSFWDNPLRFDYNRKLFEAEAQDLFSDLYSLPRNTVLRKLNDFIKRARLAKVHAYIISNLKKDMPSVFGKDNKKKELIKNLQNIYASIQQEYQIGPGDFPDLARMQERLQHMDFTKFQILKPRLIQAVDKMLAEEVTQLMSRIPAEDAALRQKNGQPTNGKTESCEEAVSATLTGGVFDEVINKDTPFGYNNCEGVNAGVGETEWVVTQYREEYDKIFKHLSPSGEKLTGSVVKPELMKSKLPNSVLAKIWKLSDINCDHHLDIDEFCLAKYLAKIKVEGHDLPLTLPSHLIPPSHRPFN